METTPYYIYQDIDAQYSTNRERRKQKLLFRVRNFIKRDELHSFDMTASTVDDVLTFMRENSDCVAFVVEGIYASRASYDKWAILRDDEAVGVTFDLYSMAICFLRTDLKKQHYKLNF